MVENEVTNIYSKINTLDSRLSKMEATQPFLQDLIERSITSNEKLGEVLQQVQLAIGSINLKIDAQAESLNAMKEDFEKTNKNIEDRIGGIDSKIRAVEDKGKFDIWAFVKTYFPWIVVLLGVGVYGVSQFVKF